jgi:hypothetical protein
MSYYHWSGTPRWVLAISALAACQSVSPSPEPVAFSFQGGASSPIAVSVRNISDDVVFLPRCGDHVLPAIERRSGDDWVNAAAAICPANLRMDPIRLDVGAVHQDKVAVTQSGTYPLRLAISRSTAALPEPVVSQSFVVE